MQVGFFSTDFSSSPVIDEMASKLVGRPRIVPGQKKLISGGTFLQRGGMPAAALAAHGYDTHASWQFRIAKDGHIQTIDRNGDWQSPPCVWTQRWMHRDGAEQFKRARSTSQIVISDLDDQFFSLPKSNVAYETTDPQRNKDFNRDWYRKNLAASSAIIVSTEALRKEVESLGPPVYLCRNAIDLAQWPMLDPGAAKDMVVSWIGGLQWRAHDIECLNPAVREFFEDYPDNAFYHGGDSQVPGVKKVWDVLQLNQKTTNIMAAPLCPINEYPKLWEPVNIALVPLEQCRFNQGKSYLKSLEACASGVPYIVSDGFPEQQILIDEGSAGRVANNRKPMSWYNHLTDLLDPSVRRTEGIQNRLVAEKHDIKDRWVDWHEVFVDLGVGVDEREQFEVASIAA